MCAEDVPFCVCLYRELVFGVVRGSGWRDEAGGSNSGESMLRLSSFNVEDANFLGSLAKADEARQGSWPLTIGGVRLIDRRIVAGHRQG